MSATDTRIPVSEGVRKELRVLKAQEDRRSYDDLLRKMAEDYNPGSRDA